MSMWSIAWSTSILESLPIEEFPEFSFNGCIGSNVTSTDIHLLMDASERDRNWQQGRHYPGASGAGIGASWDSTFDSTPTELLRDFGLLKSRRISTTDDCCWAGLSTDNWSWNWTVWGTIMESIQVMAALGLPRCFGARTFPPWPFSGDALAGETRWLVTGSADLGLTQRIDCGLFVVLSNEGSFNGEWVASVGSSTAKGVQD